MSILLEICLAAVVTMIACWCLVSWAIAIMAIACMYGDGRRVATLDTVVFVLLAPVFMARLNVRRW